MLGDFTGLDLFFVLATIVLSLSLHEAMHGFAAHWLGDDTAKREGRLTLNPLAHIDPIMTVLMPIVTLLIFHVPFLAAKPVPFNPDRVKYDEFGGAIIGAAGPLTNLALAIVGSLLLHVAAPGSVAAEALNIFTTLNVVIFVFNLLPIPPLDGSRVLYAFAPEPLQELMQSIEQFGFFILFALIFVFNLGGFVSHIAQTVINILP